MNRTNRIALLSAAVLLLIVTGSVVAGPSPDAGAPARQPQADEVEGPPTAEELARVRDRLEEKGIGVTDDVLADLASRYGMGGAVRLLAWSDETASDVETIAAMRDGTDTEPGMGWGRIARELEVHPGIGSIMGNGHGREGAPGQQKDETGE